MACSVSEWSHQMGNTRAAIPASENTTPCVSFFSDKHASAFLPYFALALPYFRGGRPRVCNRFVYVMNPLLSVTNLSHVVGAVRHG